MTYGFHAPSHAADLRLVLTAHSAADHDRHQLAYSTPYGEVRTLSWLTKADAHARAKLLRARGYRVNVSSMGI